SIVAISPDTLELAELADNGTTRGFRPDACLTFGAVAEIRAAATQPWAVFSSNTPFPSATTVSGTVRGRMPHLGTFVIHERRFDYPRNSYPTVADCAPQNPPCAVRPPILANDASFAFSITGPDPTALSGLSYFQWTISSGQAPLSFIDTVTAAG